MSSASTPMVSGGAKHPAKKKRRSTKGGRKHSTKHSRKGTSHGKPRRKSKSKKGGSPATLKTLQAQARQLGIPLSTHGKQKAKASLARAVASRK